VHDVFISYARANRNVADAICHALERRGVRCWYAPRDIQPGKSWSGAIIDAKPTPQILISFSNVEHLSSAALGTLITINNKVRRQGGELRLADIGPQIYEVFVITKLNKLFEIHDTSADALSSFG